MVAPHARGLAGVKHPQRVTACALKLLSADGEFAAKVRASAPKRERADAGGRAGSRQRTAQVA